MASMSFSKSLGSITLDGFTVLRNQEFGEIPLDVAVLLHALADGLEESLGSLSLQTVVLLGGSLSLQILKDGLGIGAVDIALLHDLECHTIVQLTELFNFAVISRILLLELVTGETDNHQSLVLILLVQFLQSCELGRKTTLAGCVHHQQYLTLKL